MRYFRPTSNAELFDLLLNEPTYTLLAGGTDLLPRYIQNKPLPKCLIDIKRLPRMTQITERSNSVELGGCVTMEQIKKSQLINDWFEALSLSTAAFAAVQIRHRATIGGNIMNASPAGDTLPALFLFNARIRLLSADGERIIPIDELILSPGRTSIKYGEVIAGVILPRIECQSTFYKLGLREAMAISVLNFAVSYKVEHGRFSDLSITAGAVAPTIKRLTPYAEAVIADPSAIESAIGLVDEQISPIDDLRASAIYRRNALKNVLKYTLQDILENL